MRCSRPLGKYAVASVAGYLVGTFPTADVVSRALGGGDLRAQGTGNPGAANAAATLGAKAGLAILVGDIAKGAAAGKLGRAIAGDDGTHVGSSAAVIGHCLPVFNGFRGGKGVATSVGQVLVGFPAHFPIDAAVAVATAAVPFWKQRAFAATVTASAVWVASATVWWRRDFPNLWGPPPTAALPISAAVSSGVIAWRFIAAAGPQLAEEAPEPESGSDVS